MSLKLNITGRNLVEAALNSPYVQVDSITTNEHFFKVMNLKQYQRQCSIHINNKKGLGKSRELIQAVIHYCPYTSYDEDLIASFKTILYLDHLNDPQNIGNALRHALAFDVDAVILPQHKSCPLNDTVARGSVGALFQLPIFYISGVNPFLSKLKKAGFGMIGTALEGAEPFHNDVFWPKSIIAIGSEGSGLRESTIKICDSLVKIEHNPLIQSLNAATTATLLCYERSKLRSK